MPQLEHSCMQRSKELNLSINHPEVMACMRSSALAVSFFTTASVRCGPMHAWSSRPVPRKQGRKMSMAPYKICKRESRTAFTPIPSVPIVRFQGRPHPNGIALRPGLLLPCPLLWWFSFSPWLVSTVQSVHAMQSVVTAVVLLSRTSTCCMPPHLQNPSDASICFSVCFRADLNAEKPHYMS